MAIASFRDNTHFLSNFHHSPITYEGITYRAVENAFQAAKTLDKDLRMKFASMTPSEAKKLGKTIVLRPDWEDVKVDIMRTLLYKKFAYMSPLYFQLLMTSGHELIEGNTWHDNFWGACGCPRCVNKEHKNTLGKLLMEVREAPLWERAIMEGEQDRYALILSDKWYYFMKDELTRDIMNHLRVTGILLDMNREATLYHSCATDCVEDVMSHGFHEREDEGNCTFGDDVVYAYNCIPYKEPKSSILLKIRVKHYWLCTVKVDDEYATMRECCFQPSDVLEISYAR